MKPRFFIFCYRGDAKLLPGRIDNIRFVFPEAPIHLIDDKANPIPARCVHMLEEQGVSYELSAFARFGNLNGAECIAGMLDVYAKHLRMDEVAVKTDADCVFIDGEAVRKVVVGSSLGFAAAQVAHYLYGGYFYMIRADVLACVRKWLPHPAAILQGAHEDVTIGALAYACATMLNYRCDFLWDSRFGGRTGAFSYRFTGVEREQYLDRLIEKKAVMLTLGNPGVGKGMILEAQKLLMGRVEKAEKSRSIAEIPARIQETS